MLSVFVVVVVASCFCLFFCFVVNVVCFYVFLTLGQKFRVHLRMPLPSMMSLTFDGGVE